MAWVAKLFAEEQQLKDVEEGRYGDRSETSSMERPRWGPEVLDISRSSLSSNISRTDGRTTNGRREVSMKSRSLGGQYALETTKNTVPWNSARKLAPDVWGSRRNGRMNSESLSVSWESCRNQAESLVDIKIEDHGKAILTFTIVTIIFLPLSFVCSYLGMNTVDIRSTASTQSLFWYTALPLASVLMLTA
jgi:hypothetical protein